MARQSNGSLRAFKAVAIVGVAIMAALAWADGEPTGQSSGGAMLKAAPGAVLMVWKGKETEEPEIAAMVDKQKTFDMRNALSDPSVKAIGKWTSRWIGILNVHEPGLYTFNFVHHRYSRGDSAMAIYINDTLIASNANGGTGSKNVQLPGPVTLKVVLYSDYATSGRNQVLIRFKKAGTLNYTTITPEMLYHEVE